MDTSRLKSMRIGVALRALRELIDNPEDTPRVFEIVRALGRSALRRGLRRFRTTEVGQRVLREREDLIETLRDRDTLAALRPGTLGRAYHDFIYGESLSADGLVAASMHQGVQAYNFKDPDLRRFGERMRDQHDLWHTLTQYGRDPFGELCLLTFTYAQTRNRGVGLIVVVESEPPPSRRAGPVATGDQTACGIPPGTGDRPSRRVAAPLVVARASHRTGSKRLGRFGGRY